MSSTTKQAQQGPTLGEEGALQERFNKMQKERGAEGADHGMTESQARMQSKPDCGEQSYHGHGRLENHVVLVTGGDSGIGRAVSIACAREGADVCIVYRSHSNDAEDTAQYVKRAGRRCLLLKLDVSSASDCKQAVERVLQEWGRLDSLILNAGVQWLEQSSLEELTPERLETVFKTNVFSSAYLAAAAEEALASSHGTIVFNTSINTFAGHADLVSYTASKGAAQALMRSLARKLISKGVRVNAVAPGPIWTPFITGSFSPEKVKSFGEANPMKRAGQPVECAGAFIYLCSSESSYVNAATIHVDGGQYTSS